MVYPNPSDGLVTITHNLGQENPEVKIFTISGKHIQTYRLTGNILNISHLEPGLYVLSIGTKDKTGIKIIMIE
jgi:hypothetical protein